MTGKKCIYSPKKSYLEICRELDKLPKDYQLLISKESRCVEIRNYLKQRMIGRRNNFLKQGDKILIVVQGKDEAVEESLIEVLLKLFT